MGFGGDLVQAVVGIGLGAGIIIRYLGHPADAVIGVIGGPVGVIL